MKNTDDKKLVGDMEMHVPTFSVVITCYNYGKYLAGCLESVLGQTFQDFEIILVNDGSTDDTDQVVAPYLTNSKITYIKQGNTGQTRAKNTGIKSARGKFIAFLDADDQWDWTKLEKQLMLFGDPSVGVVYSLTGYIDEEGKKVSFKHESRYLKPKAGKVTRWLYLDNFIPFSSSVVRRICFEKCGVFDESLRMGIDWDLWLRISVSYLFAYADEALLNYRLGHPGQMSGNVDERFRCAERIMAKFVEQNPEFLPDSIIRKGKVYTLCNRGKYYQGINPELSNHFFLLALRSRPFSLDAYMGLVKNFISKAVGLG